MKDFGNPFFIHTAIVAVSITIFGMLLFGRFLKRFYWFVYFSLVAFYFHCLFASLFALQIYSSKLEFLPFLSFLPLPPSLCPFIFLFSPPFSFYSFLLLSPLPAAFFLSLFLPSSSAIPFLHFFLPVSLLSYLIPLSIPSFFLYFYNVPSSTSPHGVEKV